jgi:endonuclease YncB( thermonuclease family)
MLRRPRLHHPVARQIRRRQIARWGALLGMLLLGGSALLDRRGAFAYRGDDWSTYDQKLCLITSIQDGDSVTLHPAAGGPTTRVRLFGIDTPETHDKRTGQPAYWSKQATGYLSGRTKDRNVTVRLETTQTRDRYGRLLAYLYLTDTDNLNLDLVRDGQAYADRRFPHTFKAQFEQAENDARTKGRGLWKEVTEEQMPEWRQKWLAGLRGAKNRK